MDLVRHWVLQYMAGESRAIFNNVCCHLTSSDSMVLTDFGYNLLNEPQCQEPHQGCALTHRKWDKYICY
jgi:hypothetical protein